MKVSSDVFAVQNEARRDEDGKQISAEEAPAARILGAEIPIVCGQQQVSGSNLNSSLVRVQGKVHEFACGARHQCHLCKHFDNETWRSLYMAWMFDDTTELNKAERMEQKAACIRMRAQLMDQFSGGWEPLNVDAEGDIDLDKEMLEFGLCRPLTDQFGPIHNEPYVTHPFAGCPTQVGDMPVPDLFEPRDSVAAQAGTSFYDKLLKTAQGRMQRTAHQVIKASDLVQKGEDNE